MRRLISVAVVTAAVMGLMVLWVTMPAGAHDDDPDTDGDQSQGNPQG